jgi:hypothetical protein
MRSDRSGSLPSIMPNHGGGQVPAASGWLRSSPAVVTQQSVRATTTQAALIECGNRVAGKGLPPTKFSQSKAQSPQAAPAAG